tara:strand:- start:802 stop:1005 length:204 start_codon:yes stop_codon:yes gene_type:complete
MNNADSFAMAFDQIWNKEVSKLEGDEIDHKGKIDLALSRLRDHPFLVENPSKAREVALFRIRLLKLK